MLFTAICNVQSWENALPVDTAARNCMQSYRKRNKCFPFFCWRKSHPLLLGISTWEKDVTDGNGICKATNKERQTTGIISQQVPGGFYLADQGRAPFSAQQQKSRSAQRLHAGGLGGSEQALGCCPCLLRFLDTVAKCSFPHIGQAI